VFTQKKDQYDQVKLLKDTKIPKVFAFADCNIDHSPFLKALAEREADVKSGRMTTIIFIRDKQKNKNEISGYIDLAHRFKIEKDFKKYYEYDGNEKNQAKKFLPKASDLSYYNWDTGKPEINDSPNFRVDANSDSGLLFRNKRDRK
jgi:hypothetical protein